MKIWKHHSFVLSHITRLTETDRQTEFSSLYRVCIPCSAVKIVVVVFVLYNSHDWQCITVTLFNWHWFRYYAAVARYVS